MNQHLEEMAEIRTKDNGEQEHVDPTLLFDALYCSDEIYEDGENQFCFNSNFDSILLRQEPLYEDEELRSLLLKESDQYNKILEPDPVVSGSRREAVDWILTVNAYHSFSSLTALLAVNYLDRFIFRFDGFRQDEKPWMAQLATVACLSLAAKVEETQVPLLLDLQVEDTSKYVFEPRTIQRMEILILSTLGWRMNPLTPLSFIDYITRRLGLNDHLCWEFIRRCELTLLSVVSDCRFMFYTPSVMAAATALHVVSNLAPSTASEFRTQLEGVLKIDKDKLDACSKLILELASSPSIRRSRSNKRKLGPRPGSPGGVMDVSFSFDSLNDSSATSASSSVNSSPLPSSKKSKSHRQDNETTQSQAIPY